MGRLFIAVALAVIGSHHCLADADISFHGRLVEYVPCVVNGGEDITVDFGDEVMTTRIEDGAFDGAYAMSFLLSNDCPSGSLIRYQIKGTAVASDNKLLAGDRDGLGFRFWHTDYLTLNKWFNSTSGGIPIIYVAPARVNDTAIEGGPFRIVATLLAEYQ